MARFCGHPYRFLGTASTPAEMIALIEQARHQERNEATIEAIEAELNNEQLLRWLEGGDEKGVASPDLHSSSPD